MIDKIIIALYNSIILLIPYTLNYRGISYSKILFIFSILVSLYLIVTKKLNFNIFKNKFIKYLTVGFIILFAVVFVSNGLSFIINKKIVLTDVFEIIRPFQYYSLIINYYILLKTKDNRKIFNISLIVLFIINILYAFVQYFDIFELNDKYIELIAPTQYRTLINNYSHPRAVGLAGNPNVFGFIMSMFGIYFLNLILKQPKKIYIYILYVLCIVGIFLASSRTSYVAVIVGSICLLFFYYFRFKKENIIKFSKVMLIFVVLQFTFLFVLPNKLTWRIKGLFTIGELTSWQDRVDKNHEYLDSFFTDNEEQEEYKNDNSKQEQEIAKVEQEEEKEKTEIKVSHKWYNYIIGHGTNKNNQIRYFDNEWLLFFHYYGILGLLAFVFMLIFPLLAIGKEVFNAPVYISIVIMNFSYMIPAGSYHIYLLFGLISIFIAYCLNSENEDIKIKKIENLRK